MLSFSLYEGTEGQTGDIILRRLSAGQQKEMG